MKKFYESPSVEKNSLRAEEKLMNTVGASDIDYGFADLEDGPGGLE